MFPRHKLVFFSETIDLYENYYKINNNPLHIKPEGFSISYTLEGIEKLYQLDFLCRKIFEYEEILLNKIIGRNEIFRAYVDFHRDRNMEINSSPEYHTIQQIEKDLHLDFEIKLYCEAFYYIAFRIRNIIRYSYGLGKSFECSGVRNVRNILIEHPEKFRYKIHNNSFESGGKDGPKINPSRNENDHTFRDPGLFINAEEFKKNLGNTLTSFVSNYK